MHFFGTSTDAFLHSFPKPPFHQCSIIPPPKPACENELRVPFLPASSSRQAAYRVQFSRGRKES